MGENPLRVGDLEGAAYLCLVAAALTDRDQFPLGSGGCICDGHHHRRRRFETAVSKMLARANLYELGLLPGDCKWAADQAERAKDPDDWRRRFTLAAEKLAARNADQNYRVEGVAGELHLLFGRDKK